MRILFLDDDQHRINVFVDWCQQRGHGDVRVVKTSAEAIEALTHSDFDIIFLDHDLGGEQMVESGPGTGQEVAQWLADRFNYLIHTGILPKVVVHSWNPEGGKRMFNTLTDVGFDAERIYFGPSLVGWL